MITVAIFINGNPIMARSATNKMERNDRDETKYITDCGKVLWHHRDAGAIPLAHKLLDAIQEQGVQAEAFVKRSGDPAVDKGNRLG